MIDSELEKILREREGYIFVEEPSSLGQIPVITVRGKSLAQAWENSMLALYAYGCEVRTEYDRRDNNGAFIDPPSKDCSMRMIVSEPESEPLIHRAFPGSLEDLEEYREEVLDGIKDHWIRDHSDPEDKRWEYTYHERLFNYKRAPNEKGVNQIEKVIEKLSKIPHTRRAQAITWQAWLDPEIDDPPCLQSLWFRLMEAGKGEYLLNLNVRFRSRDAYDAAFMNCFALLALMERVARGIEERAGFRIRLGRYVDESDSYHIYGHRLRDFEERFLKQVMTRSFEERTWTREFAEPFFESAKPRIKEKIKRHNERG